MRQSYWLFPEIIQLLHLWLTWSRHTTKRPTCRTIQWPTFPEWICNFTFYKCFGILSQVWHSTQINFTYQGTRLHQTIEKLYFLRYVIACGLPTQKPFFFSICERSKRAALLRKNVKQNVRLPLLTLTMFSYELKRNNQR